VSDGGISQAGSASLAVRTGIGFDAHRLAPDRKLVLGGVEIPHDNGLAGHSDGDVLLHAIIDALLGAARLGDIGEHFPSSDERYRDVSSRVLLRTVGERLTEAGYVPGNIDAVLVAERPKIAPYRAEMIARIAEDLGMDPGQVSVKGTTTDGLGATGRGEGIAAWATATVIAR
jgi:2-C-methyl-D-erythritol 2,4-cyclodiphosphate synthase